MKSTPQPPAAESLRKVFYYKIGITVIFVILCSTQASTSVAKIVLRDDFDDQVRQLIANVKMPDTRLRMIPGVLQAVQHTLSNVWPDCQVRAYGATVAGIALSNSDLDISVALPTAAYTDDFNVLLQAKTAFEEFPTIYNNVTIRTNKTVPLVTLYFVPADISCDVNIKSRMGSFSTDLLYYLLHADERALKMAFIIKYWAKVNSLTGNKFLSNYSVLMLLIFLLQQQRVLPSVAELQRNATPYIYSDDELTNVAFEKKYVVKRNNESVYTLLGRYFEYYANFDFDKFIVCPYTGKPVEKKLFTKLERVPEEFYLYKYSVEKHLSKPLNISEKLCVQDPLEHCKNDARKVGDELVHRFKANIKNAAKLYRERDKNSFLNALLAQR